MTAEANRILDHLVGMPAYGNATCEKPVLREIMLQTGGSMMARGYLWDIKSESLGAGVYRLSLEQRQ